MNLKIKFILFFIFVVLAPLFLLGIVALNIVKETHIRAIGELERQFLAQKEKELSRFIEEAKSAFEVTSGSDDVSSLSVPDQEFLARSIFGSNGSVSEVVFFDLSGRETLKIRRNSRGEEMVSEFADLSDSRIFQSARKGDVFLGPLFWRDGNVFMPLSRPVRNRSGLIIMVVAGEVNLSKMQSFLEGSTLGNEGYVVIVDKGHTVFAASKEAFVGKTYSQSGWLAAIFDGEPAVGPNESNTFDGLQNRPVFASGILMNATDWALVVEWPKDDALGSLRSLRKQMAGFFTLLALFVAGGGSILARKVLKPVAVLKKGVGIIGAGNLDYKIQVQTKDELEELANAFNRMSGDLKEAQKRQAQIIHAEAFQEAFQLEKEISKNKSDFITNISHQLRTPISIMNWALELAQNTDDHKKKATHLESLKNGIEQLRFVTNDLLVISEFGIGYKIAKGVKFEFSLLLEEVVQSRQAPIGEKKIKLQKDIQENIPKFYGSKIGIQKALEQIFDNALAYTKEGGNIILRLGFGNGVLHFSCQDTGIGIPRVDQPSVFSAFFRAGNAVEQKNVGTGLGLLIAKNIVEGHGGKIWFESDQGKGSTFYVDLPMSFGQSKG